MSLHHEVHLEAEIYADLVAAGWLHDPADAGRFDRPTALFVDDLVAWVPASQPKVVEAMSSVLPTTNQSRAGAVSRAT